MGKLRLQEAAEPGLLSQSDRPAFPGSGSQGFFLSFVSLGQLEPDLPVCPHLAQGLPGWTLSGELTGCLSWGASGHLEG